MMITAHKTVGSPTDANVVINPVKLQPYLSIALI